MFTMWSASYVYIAKWQTYVYKSDINQHVMWQSYLKCIIPAISLLFEDTGIVYNIRVENLLIWGDRNTY